MAHQTALAPWKNVTFDLSALDDRAGFKEDNPGSDLPVTHENNAVLHATLCRRLRDARAELDNEFPYVASLRVEIEGPDSVDFALLDEFTRLSETLVRQLKGAPAAAPGLPMKRTAKRKGATR